MSLLFAQLCHSISLADVCDTTALRLSRLSLLRGARAPARNTLSNANTHRDPKLMEKLFWATLKLAGFIGYSKNAIAWQVWAALLVWLLARFQAFLSKWTHSFTRLMALLRSHAWERIHIVELLQFHGTARSMKPP